MAYSLLDKTNETNVCVFDTEDSVENIYDHVFPQVPDVVVGKFNITPEVKLYPCSNQLLSIVELRNKSYFTSFTRSTNL